MIASPEHALGPSLRAGGWLVGTVISSCDPLLAERVAREFDFVWIDLEHSALSVRDAQMLAIAASAGGAACLARLPSSTSELLGALLDVGVDGIVAPKLESASEAASFVQRTRYPPAGTRGFAPRRASRRRAGATDLAPGDVVRMVQIETRLALENAEAIARTDGVDALIVGTADLSFGLGVPLDLLAPQLAAAVSAVGQAATLAGKPWGVAASGLSGWVGSIQNQGASLLVYASDARIYAEAVSRSRTEIARVFEAGMRTSSPSPQAEPEPR